MANQSWQQLCDFLQNWPWCRLYRPGSVFYRLAAGDTKKCRSGAKYGANMASPEAKLHQIYVLNLHELNKPIDQN